MTYVCLATSALASVLLKAVLTHVEGGPTRVAAFVLVLTVMAVPVVWVIRSATLVHPDAIAIRGLFRTRRIRWADIATIQAEDTNPPIIPGPARLPRDRVVVRDRHGKPTVLPHLNSQDLGSWGRTLNGELPRLHRWRASGTGTSRRRTNRRR